MKFAALLACLLVFSSALFPQQHTRCGFDAAHHKMLLNNPAYKAAVEGIENNARVFRESGASQRIASGVYIMPVVVHVVHTGGLNGSLYNPTDVQITSAIAYLNSVYNGTAPNRNGEGVGDITIQFELAKRDPNCNPTNGINHVNGSSLAGYVANGVIPDDPTDVAMKNFIRWDPTKYCNIWVVNKIDGYDGTSGSGTGGYAYFPFSATVDGVVILATAMTSGNSTLAHEMGHVFSLYHPFEGSGPNGTSCPPISNTTGNGDRVTDTDPITLPPDYLDDRTGDVNLCANGGGTVNYKIETEHNIMNYVELARLFTAGQKTRMLAAITGGGYGTYRVDQINSGGDIAPDQGSPCAPKINFELGEYTILEETSGTVTVGGCDRKYKDYTFNMVIGKAPSAAATVALSGSGATENVHFNITTNGDFNAPSKTITFPSGSMASRSFTVRVYDDAMINSSNTITLDFTVNSGGGDAVKGNGRPTLSIVVNENDIVPFGPYSNTFTLNQGGNAIGGIFLPDCHLHPAKSQFLYKASELTAMGVTAGQLTSLTFNITKNGGAAFVYKNLTIRLAQTSNTTLYNSGTSTATLLNSGALTTVYSSDYTTLNGANTFPFSAPFTWDGVSNIVVTVCYSNTGADVANDIVNFYSADNSATEHSFVYTNAACATNWGGFSYYLDNFKPVINFGYSNPGTTVRSTVNTSRYEYLGANADVYFYDATSSQLLARVKNLSSHDYGCTQVVIDRGGTGATAFQNSNTNNYLMDKTFRVVPATNNGSGQYEITLYYTAAEVTGWQNATGQLFSNIQLVKVPNQIKDASPGNPSGAGTAVQVDPVRGTLGTNYSLTYTFSTGFSGFGAGVAAVVLPSRLLDLNGRRSGNDIFITWSTVSEINSKVFDIERSEDGIHFIKVGSVAARANSTVVSKYEFRDLNNTNELNYYRLKMIDLDGRSESSKIITVQSAAGNKTFAVVNPVRDNLDLQFGQIRSGIAEIRMLNASGQAVLRWRGMISANQHTLLPLNSAITRGVYTVHVLQGDQQFVRKVVKP